MDNENHKSRTRRLRGWFKRKHKRAGPFYLGEVTDWGEDEGDDYQEDVFVRSMENGPCFLTNELKVFVGTWNVARRSPVGSLVVDVVQWLNLKDAADIYVLGFQEIVPLNTRNVIGAEDPTEATNWNLLTGKTLNEKYGCPWSTPILNPITSDNYHYAGVSGSERRASVSSRTATSTGGQLNEQPNQCSRYKHIASKKMVGVFITVWMKRELLRRYSISSVKVCSVACGIMAIWETNDQFQ